MSWFHTGAVMAADPPGTPPPPKFRIDDIVLPEGAQMARAFGCAVCLNIAQEPVVQTACGHVYCRDCVAPCPICPQCREPLPASAVRLMSEVNKMGMRMMFDIPVRCPYAGPRDSGDSASSTASSGHQSLPPSPKRARKVAGELCEWVGTYGDLLAKHLSDCPRHLVPCPKGCGVVLQRGDLETHRLSCERNFEECAICGERVSPGDMASHRRERAETHVELLQGRLSKHEASAGERDAICTRLNRMEEQMKAMSKAQHIADIVKASEKEVKAEVRRHTLARAIWTLRGIEVLKTSFPKTKSIQSPKFDVGGISGLSLIFYPCGDRDADAGKGSLFVSFSDKIDATFRLTICGKTHELSMKGTGEFNSGFDCPAPAAANAAEDTVKIEVEVIRAALMINT